MLALVAAVFAAVVPAFAPSAVALPVGPQLVDTVTYRIDVSQSRLVFKIRHFVSKVEGRFDKWSGAIVTEPDDFSKGTVEVAIEAASINTNNSSRDNDLRSGNFFLSDSFPTITFKSSKVEVAGTALIIHGDLTMRGVTRPIVLEGEYLGRQGAIGPGERIGFKASTKVDRTDWGVAWNRVVEGGGAMLGDEVTIAMTVSGVRPQARPVQ